MCQYIFLQQDSAIKCETVTHHHKYERKNVVKMKCKPADMVQNIFTHIAVCWPKHPDVRSSSSLVLCKNVWGKINTTG